MFLTTHFEDQFGRNRCAGLVDPLFAGEDLACADQGLGLGPAVGKAAFNQQDVGTLARSRGSGPPPGGFGFGVNAEGSHGRSRNIRRSQSGKFNLPAG